VRVTGGVQDPRGGTRSGWLVGMRLQQNGTDGRGAQAQSKTANGGPCGARVRVGGYSVNVGVFLWWHVPTSDKVFGNNLGRASRRAPAIGKPTLSLRGGWAERCRCTTHCNLMKPRKTVKSAFSLPAAQPRRKALAGAGDFVLVSFFDFILCCPFLEQMPNREDPDNRDKP
jgi:hypothetical protein